MWLITLLQIRKWQRDIEKHSPQCRVSLWVKLKNDIFGGYFKSSATKALFLAFVKAQAPRCFTLIRQNTPWQQVRSHLRTPLFLGSQGKTKDQSHADPQRRIFTQILPPCLTLHYLHPPICLSSLSHPLPIPLSSLSHLSLISLLSSLSSLVHNFTAVVRQSHSFHQRDQERVFLGRGLLCTAFPQRINHVQTLMPCYTKKGMR